MLWLKSVRLQELLFYVTTHSKNHFVDTIIPSLKHSLSLTLKHYYPLAGNLVFPPNDAKPYIRYVDGDSVSLVFAESSGDFNHFVGYNRARNSLEFHPLLPDLPSVLSTDSDYDGTRVDPLAAIQVTLFPGSGICVGFNVNHAAGDGNAITGFIKAWASITKSGGDKEFLDAGLQPVFDRARLRDTKGVELETIMWNQMKDEIKIVDGSSSPSSEPHEVLPPQENQKTATDPATKISTNNNNKVRASFVLGQATVEQLKKKVRDQYCQLHVSTFTVASSYVWSCLAKARATADQEQAPLGDKMEHLIFLSDSRSGLNPPLPPTYFGNCIVPNIATVKVSQLIREDGFEIAAQSIGEAIRKRHENGVVKGIENSIPEVEGLLNSGDGIFFVSSMFRFKFYSTDFGWGGPAHCEFTSIDDTGGMLLRDAKNGEGDIEISLSRPKPIMDAFESYFTNGLPDCRNRLATEREG